MFSRRCHISLTCSRCRRWLAGSNQFRYPFENSSTPLRLRKWQSTATAEIDHEEDSAQRVGDVTPRIQEPGSRSASQEPEETQSMTKRPAQGGTYFRRWRQHQSHDLGVNVLGQPAEVLILPTRKKKSMDIAAEQSAGENAMSLQKALNAEARPVSIDDVLKNIDSLKLELGKGRQDFSASEWKEHKRRLASAFTRAQLEEYMQRHADTDGGELGQVNTTTGSQKRNLANSIMLTVWKWTCHDVQSTSLGSKPKPSTKLVMVNAAKLNYIMLHEKEQLRYISEDLDVQIDIFKKKSRIQLTGDPSSVKEANTKLSQIIKNLQWSSLPASGHLQGLLADVARSKTVLSMLMQKHKISIETGQEMLNIIGPTNSDPDVVLRDLLLLSHVRDEPTRFSICHHAGQGQTTAVPVYPGDVPEWLSQGRSWCRHVSTTFDSNDTDSAGSFDDHDIQKMIRTLLKTEKHDQQKLSQFSVAPGSLSHEYTASLGQALLAPGSLQTHTDLADPTDPSSPDTRTVRESLLVLQQPLLPQVLSTRKFKHEKIPEHLGGDYQENLRPFLIHLRLQPIENRQSCPPIEIYLQGRDSNLGLRQKLEIRRVSAILDTWHHYLLLPNCPLDICLGRSSKIDLFRRNDGRPTKAYLDILRQVGTYLERAGTSDQARLPSIWHLNLTPLLKKKTNARQPANKEKAHIDDNSSAYILEPPEFLDVTSYTIASTDDRYLDYISCDTHTSEKPRQRHILRVAQHSLANLLHDKTNDVGKDSNSAIERQRRFTNSVTTAFDIATRFQNAEKLARKVS